MDSQSKLESELQAEFAAVLTELGFSPDSCPVPTVAEFERVLDRQLRHKMAPAGVVQAEAS